MKTDDEEDAAKSWDDISPEIRAAIIAEGRNRVFWQNVGKRMSWLKGAATIMLTLAAAYALMKDGIAQALQGWGK